MRSLVQEGGGQLFWPPVASERPGRSSGGRGLVEELLQGVRGDCRLCVWVATRSRFGAGSKLETGS